MRKFLFAGTFILLAACTKTDSTQSRRQILESGNWLQTSGRMTFKIGNKDTTQDYFKFYDTCRKQYVLQFMDANQGKINTGTMKCSVAQPATIPFEWELNNDESIITINNADAFFEGVPVVNGKITDFTSSSFTLHYLMIMGAMAGDTMTMLDTYVKR